MSHTPRPTLDADDHERAVMGLPNVPGAQPIDWDAIMSRRASKRKYGQSSSSCGSGRSSVDSFLSEDFGSGGSRSPSPEDAPNTVSSANKLKGRDQSSRPSGRDKSPLWTRFCSDWDAKWKFVPKEDAQGHNQDTNGLGLLLQPSSSSSLSLNEEEIKNGFQQKSRRKRSKYFRKTLSNAVNEALIKRRAKKWYTQLTTHPDNEGPGSNQAWRQRRVAGEELLRIAEQEADGDIVVARRFTKSLTRQMIGLRAVLRLCEDEEDSASKAFSSSRQR
ncbi:hypothetical protein FRC01_006480, partial [Tulasnella sp. 417]